jgi:hypothetical protein
MLMIFYMDTLYSRNIQSYPKIKFVAAPGVCKTRNEKRRNERNKWENTYDFEAANSF